MVRQQTGEASSALFVCFGIIVVVVTLFLIGWYIHLSRTAFLSHSCKFCYFYQAVQRSR